MKYILLSILALLHLVAAGVNFKIGHKGPWVMIAGALLVITGVILGLKEDSIQWWFILIGILLMIDSAIYNGYKQGKIDWGHHGIRILLFLLALLPLWQSTRSIH